MGTLFVYGTLKRGFANHSAEQGELVATGVDTARRYPLRIVGRYKIPWLFPLAGQGMRVTGELYRVHHRALRRLDRLEGVRRPGWFMRDRVVVRVRAASRLRLVGAWVYFGKPTEASRQGRCSDAIAEFALVHNLAYIDAA